MIIIITFATWNILPLSKLSRPSNDLYLKHFIFYVTFCQGDLRKHSFILQEKQKACVSNFHSTKGLR